MTQKERAEKKAKEIANNVLWNHGYNPTASIKEDEEALASMLCEELTAVYTENERLTQERLLVIKELEEERCVWVVEIHAEILAGNMVKEHYARGRVNGVDVALGVLKTPILTAQPEEAK